MPRPIRPGPVLRVPGLGQQLVQHFECLERCRVHVERHGDRDGRQRRHHLDALAGPSADDGVLLARACDPRRDGVRWSATGTFRSKLVGFNRAGELYDPLIHGETVGELVGSTTFIPGRACKSTMGQPRALPARADDPERRVLHGCGRAPRQCPGDKAKVFGMSDGQGDFITNDYRVDIQCRGTTGVPPNAIQWRVIYGDADDLDVRYEPDTAKRFASVFLLSPATTYHWKFRGARTSG